VVTEIRETEEHAKVLEHKVGGGARLPVGRCQSRHSSGPLTSVSAPHTGLQADALREKREEAYKGHPLQSFEDVGRNHPVGMAPGGELPMLACRSNSHRGAPVILTTACSLRSRAADAEAMRATKELLAEAPAGRKPTVLGHERKR